MNLFTITTIMVLAALCSAMAWADRRAVMVSVRKGMLNLAGYFSLMAWLLLPFAILVAVALSFVYMALQG